VKRIIVFAVLAFIAVSMQAQGAFVSKAAGDSDGGSDR